MEATQAEVGAVVSRMISSDSHLIEHPTLWEERMPDEYVERGPRVVRNDEGMDWWYVDGKRTMSFLGIQAGRRFDGDPSKLVTESTFEDVRPGAYDPKLFVKEAEEDGIVGSVLYPTEGLVLFSVPDSGLCSASMRAYNDYMAEFCAEDPHHLKGIGMINVDDPAEGRDRARPLPPDGSGRRLDDRAASGLADVRQPGLRRPVGGRPGPADAPQPAHRHQPGRPEERRAAGCRRTCSRCRPRCSCSRTAWSDGPSPT